MKQKTVLRTLLPALFALIFFALCLGPKAQAASDPGALVFDISEGNITIETGTSAGTVKVTYGGGIEDNIPAASPITLTGQSAAANNYKVLIQTSCAVVLQDLDIVTTSASPFEIAGGTHTRRWPFCWPSAWFCPRPCPLRPCP